MENKELQWHLKKVGKFSASRAADLMSASGKWIEGNIDYLYEIQYQRLTNEPTPPVYAKPMQVGIENEPYAVEWLRENYPSMILLHCDADFTEKIFDEPYADLAFGVSPDAFVMKPDSGVTIDGAPYVYTENFKQHIQSLVEIKCVVGRKNTVRYFSPTLPFEVKKEMALKEHRWQLASQMFGYPDVELIYLLKYLPQIDDNQFDLRPVTDPSRGLVFEFTRAELAIEIMQYEARVRYADAYLRSGKDLEMINTLKITL